MNRSNYIDIIYNPYDNDGQHIAFQEGIKAFTEHISIDQNPYGSDTSLGMAWEDGYDKAMELSFMRSK